MQFVAMSIEFGWILNLNHTQIGQMSFRLDFKQIKFVRQNILASRTSLTIWWMAAGLACIGSWWWLQYSLSPQTSDSRPTLFSPCSNLLRSWFPAPWPSDTPRVTQATLNTWTQESQYLRSEVSSFIQREIAKNIHIPAQSSCVTSWHVYSHHLHFLTTSRDLTRSWNVSEDKTSKLLNPNVERYVNVINW